MDPIEKAAARAIADGRHCYRASCTVPGTHCSCMREAIHAIRIYLADIEREQWPAERLEYLSTPAGWEDRDIVSNTSGKGGWRYDRAAKDWVQFDSGPPRPPFSEPPKKSEP